tara:strand:+ start:456 stop:635 length:180 start_codon:yes stop_codon:yes gene_type:complete
MIPTIEATYSEAPEPWNGADREFLTLTSRIRSWTFAAAFYMAIIALIASPAGYTVHMIT